MSAGRPTKYKPEIGQEICDAIASSHLGLADLCMQNPHWPVRSTIYLWRRTHEEFSNMYAKAKEDQVEVCIEYMQELMNEPHKFVDPETGQTKIDVQMLRCKMDAFKWHVEKLKPRKYGPKSGDDAYNKNEVIHQEAMERKNVFEKEY
jgi:hypothetical protein